MYMAKQSNKPIAEILASPTDDSFLDGNDNKDNL